MIVLLASVALAGCATGSRVLTEVGASAPNAKGEHGCRSGVTLAAIAVDAVVGISLLNGDEVSAGDTVVVGALALDTIIGATSLLSCLTE